MPVKWGKFAWDCPVCSMHFEKDTKQGLGMAKENHLRKHRG